MTQWSFLSYWIDDYSHVCFPTHQQFTQSCRHPNRPKDNAGLSCLVKCFCLWLQLEIRFHLVVIEAGGLHFFICMPGVVLYVKDLFAPLVTLWQRQYANVSQPKDIRDYYYSLFIFKGVVRIKNENLLKMYSSLGHPRWNILEKFSITSLAHQRILCSEWVPS